MLRMETFQLWQKAEDSSKISAFGLLPSGASEREVVVLVLQRARELLEIVR
jgi:hypothetical protein